VDGERPDRDDDDVGVEDRFGRELGAVPDGEGMERAEPGAEHDDRHRLPAVDEPDGGGDDAEGRRRPHAGGEIRAGDVPVGDGGGASGPGLGERSHGLLPVGGTAFQLSAVTTGDLTGR